MFAASIEVSGCHVALVLVTYGFCCEKEYTVNICSIKGSSIS